jgi:hypothetical protein
LWIGGVFLLIAASLVVSLPRRAVVHPNRA